MKNACIDVLQLLPGKIKDAENVLVEASFELQEAKEVLADKEAELLLSAKIDGKNAEIRSAQMRGLTGVEHDSVVLCENKVSRAKAKLNAAVNEFKAWRSIAGLLKEVE